MPDSQDPGGLRAWGLEALSLGFPMLAGAAARGLRVVKPTGNYPPAEVLWTGGASESAFQGLD